MFGGSYHFLMNTRLNDFSETLVFLAEIYTVQIPRVKIINCPRAIFSDASNQEVDEGFSVLQGIEIMDFNSYHENDVKIGKGLSRLKQEFFDRLEKKKLENTEQLRSFYDRVVSMAFTWASFQVSLNDLSKSETIFDQKEGKYTFVDNQNLMQYRTIVENDKIVEREIDTLVPGKNGEMCLNKCYVKAIEKGI